MKVQTADGLNKTLIDSQISTEHRGKGSFNFVHLESYQRIYLELEVQQPISQIIQRDVYVRPFVYVSATSSVDAKPYIYNQNNEVTFTVLNKNRVIPGFGDKNGGVVSVRIQTNDYVNPSDRYLLQLKFKEQVIGETQL